MKQANSNYSTSRRRLLGGSTAAAVVGAIAVLAGRTAAAAASVGSGDDAELFDLLRRFAVAESAVRGSDDETILLTEDELLAALDQWWAALEGITLIPARTAPGVRAKAEITPAVMRRMEGIECDDGHNFALSLARDVLAVGV